MKKMLCPQCKIAAMYVKNAAGERLLVYVTDQGEVVPKDASKAFFLYKKSADSGCVYAMYNLGSDYYFGIGTSKDVASARKYFHEAALNGHPEGMYMYGKCCLLGLGGDTNYQEAFSFTEMAANKGDINALDG